MTGFRPLLDRNARTALICGGIAAVMIGLAYASAPLYDLFCRVTGFAGTPVVRTLPSKDVLERTVAVRFDANVLPGLNWRFAPEAPQVEVKVGETATVHYRTRNEGPAPATGVATFNVQPALAGAYFVKIQCFCFTEQTLQPGEAIDSAVVFYIDPGIAADPNLKDLRSITLSYTYFPAREGSVAEAATSSKPDLR